jgi:hypothetical protein
VKQITQLSHIVPLATIVILLVGAATAEQSSIRLRSGKEVKVVKVGPVLGGFSA